MTCNILVSRLLIYHHTMRAGGYFFVIGLFQKVKIHPYGGAKLRLHGRIKAKLIESGGKFDSK